MNAEPTAIISDIHGNLEALEAVLKDIERQGVKRIFSLGDVIGYNPNPVECLEISRNFALNLMGNHEAAVLDWELVNDFSDEARASLEWTRKKLTPELLDYLRTFVLRHEEGDGKFIYVHGSPRPGFETRDYVYPSPFGGMGSRAWEVDMSNIFKHVNQICFIGHLHIPFILPENLVSSISRESPTETPVYFAYPDRKYLITNTDRKIIVNVGSVGQPRDRDNTACYVILYGDSFVFRRVSYNFQETRGKLQKIPELDPNSGHRLERGR